MLENVIKKLCGNFRTKGIPCIFSSGPQGPKTLPILVDLIYIPCVRVYIFVRLCECVFGKCAQLTVSKWVCTSNTATASLFECIRLFVLSHSISFKIVIKLKSTWTQYYDREASLYANILCSITRCHRALPFKRTHS